MSDGDVSLIRDEDLLRRMWQQTEDFSRKKEIRAHMYRLREERLRSLYSPEPTVNPAKGCEFSSTQGHVKSFADQSFQSMKSKEVRDAGSPPKEFTYRGQDLKDLSNAGWNVESENRTTDDGHTHVKSVNANIQGRYDVDGGKGQFSAADHHKQAITEYNDGNSSLKRNEDYSNTSANEQVVRQTDDGMHFTSTSSSSTSASKFEQVSSKHETVPYLTNDDYDLASQKFFDTNTNEQLSTQKIFKTSNLQQNEHSLRTDREQGELVSRKIDYPDDNTKVIVETRCLPDGTRVTSTRREFRAPSVQTSHSEHHSQQIRNESKETSYSTSQKRFHTNESTQKIHDSIDKNIQDIVDSQRTKDDHDFKTNKVTDYNNDISQRRYHQDIKTTEINECKLHESVTRNEVQNIRKYDVKQKQSIDIEDNNMKIEKKKEEINNIKENENNRSEYFSSNDELKKTRTHKNNEDHRQITKERHIGEPQNPDSKKSSHLNLISSLEDQNIHHQDDIKETLQYNNIEERVQNIINESNVKGENEKSITDKYQTTYQNDYSQRKISKDWSPTHQAWASTLRSDTPPQTTRVSSPGTKAHKSSTSSPRSSVSPDKIYKRTPSRSVSPNKIDRNSPTRTISDKTFSSTQSSTYSVYETKSNRYTNDEISTAKNKSPTRQLCSPERKLPDEIRKRPSVSPEKEIKTPSSRSSVSPQRKTRYPTDSDRYSPIRNIPTRTTPSPERKRSNGKQISSTIDSDECSRESEKIKQTSSKNIVTHITSNTTTYTENNAENTTSTSNNITEYIESLEKQPGYMRPTLSSSPDSNRPLTPSKSIDSEREFSIRRTPSQSPERKYPSKLDKVKEQNNRFISEENKMYTNKNIISDSSELHRKSPNKETSPDHHIKKQNQPDVSPERKLHSPLRKSPMKDIPAGSISQPSFDYINSGKSSDTPPTESYKKPSREHSPVKQTFGSPSKKTPTKDKPQDKSNKPNKQPSRETSPIKRNGSPDKDYCRPIDDISMISAEGNENNEVHDLDKRLKNRSPSPNINSVKESSTTRNTHSPSKESSKHKATETTENFVRNIDDIDQMYITKTLNEGKNLNSINNKKSDTKLDTRTSHRSVSPKKPKMEDMSTCKQTLDFIVTERSNIEMNKTTMRERPRNLVTPSTSPTRKTKSEDTAPSTGQSSPTMESGFVYFGSPREKILVTDLDDQESSQTDGPKKQPTNENCRKEAPSRTPSPTKIPCRSPSPEKVTIKESLPRKSSLKKPSIDNSHLISSVKPPTSFLISSNDEVKDEPELTQQNINTNSTKPIKNKPPLIRRETYEERCRKILGMAEEDSAATETKTILSPSKKCISSDTSPSISPCESPIQHEDKDFIQEKYETVDVLDMTNQTFSEKKCDIVSTEMLDENLNFHSGDSLIQTPSELPKTILSKDSPTQSSISKDNHNNDLHIISSETPLRKNTIGSERSVLVEIDKTQDIKKEIGQGVECYESETDTFNINQINTNITRTKHLTKNSETFDETSQKTTKSCNVKDTSSEIIVSEREQQILDKVQSSLRKLSPDRKAKITKEIRDNSPNATSSILVKSNEATVAENIIKHTSDNTDKCTNVSSEDKSRLRRNLTNEKIVNKSQIPSKSSSRNVSPIKKPGSQITPKNASENGKLRSTSPKKPITHTDNKLESPTERPQLPQISKSPIGKTKDVISSQHQKTTSTSAIKNERINIADTKKTLSHKQQPMRISPTKTATNKPFSSSKPVDVENKRPSTPKGPGHRDLPLFKKEADSKVTRTSSDIGLKSPGKKLSPQRMKSKPEIQITTSKALKLTTTVKHHKTSVKDSTTKLPVTKPKSAIALNTSIDDEYVIIDVQQAKSSRENSPDRICPTPVGFSEDVGVPRFPDEVNEPDDECTKYKNHIIHETESIVDDIVEISEEDELFVKRSKEENKKIDTTSDFKFSVNEKVIKSTNQVEFHKPMDSITCFQDTESQIHSDFANDNLKSDECLLSVSEKVNKFAKGSVGPKDRSPSRNITEEYDKDTIYTDDYTKLSVNDKAHLFIETAENVKTTKPRSIQKPERPNLTTVDDSLMSDECLLSVSDKVNKFVKTAEQILSDTYIVDEKDKRIKEQHDKIMKQIVNDVHDNLNDVQNNSVTSKHNEPISNNEEKPCGNKSDDTVTLKSESIANKVLPTKKSFEKPTPIKITTLRSTEAVKKAKALFENIASTSNPTELIHNKSIKLTERGISKKFTQSKSDTNESTKLVTNVTVPIKDGQPIIQQNNYCEEQNKERLHQKLPDNDQISEALISKEKSQIINIASSTMNTRHISPENRPVSPFTREKTPINRTLSPMAREKSPTSHIRSSIMRDKSPTLKTRSPVVKEDAPISRTKSPIPQVATITTKKVLSRFPVTEQIDSQKQIPRENCDKPIDNVPGYQRPTKTSQIREDKHFEEVDVSSRRGSGKFGVELRRTSADRSSVSSERRRSSAEHHQPCIEDIFDLDLLEQMLEKVMGYEQRRRIRAQIRIAKRKIETEQEISKATKSSKQSVIKVTKTKSPERQSQRSPERLVKTHKPQSPERQPKSASAIKSTSPDRQAKSKPMVPSIEHREPKEPLTNGHVKESNELVRDKEPRTKSPEKQIKSTPKTVRSSSPDKKSRPMSPSKAVAPKTKGNRFSEYASAYMKKVGINESNKLKHSEVQTKKAPVVDEIITKRIETNRIVETHQQSKAFSDRTSSKDVIEVEHINGRKSQSPERNFRKQSPERKPSDKTASERMVSSERLHQSPERQSNRHTSPKRSPSPIVKKVSKKETTTVMDIEKKIPQKQVQEEKPSWVTNRQLKKVTSDTRTFSSKKIETEKPKYRPSSPSKAITKPIDVITSSYGPGPLDADGKPLFGIKALRKGATNYQVKGTVVRQEFHSRNGGEPEGTVSVTAYSTEPEDLERLLQCQGERPSRLHGLAAITTTKKFGGDTGTTLTELSTKEERAALDRFTHSDRRVTESKIDTDTLNNREQRYTEGKTEEYERYGKEKKQDSEKRSKTESLRKETRKLDSDSQKETRADRMQKTERRVEDRKTVRQSSVKSLTEKFIKNASETAKIERTVYPKAGLILRTAGMKDSVSSDSSAHAGLARTDSEHSLGSVEDTVTTTTTTEQVGDVVRTTTTTTKTGGRTQERSFLDSSTKVTGVQDILTRMKNADIVIEEGDTSADSEARALLNKFLGATVLMAGMQSYVTDVRQETVKSHSISGGGKVSSSRKQEDFDLEQCWDERVLRKLLDECTDYEVRRRVRARIRALMAEQEACASAVTEALAAAGETVDSVDTEEHQQSGEREEEEVTTVTSSVRRNSSEQTVSSTTVKNTKVIECRPAPKPVSPFAKFRQLEKQNSINSPNSPNTPQSPGSPSQPYFKFTDPALQLSAVTIKERLLQWCRDKTRDYENVKLENFSTSWADGLAFCALLHHFRPDAFDYSQLTPDKRRHNFTLAFKIADEKAGIYPLLDVDDMVAMRRPDWKCVFTYVQSIYRRFKDEQ